MRGQDLWLHNHYTVQGVAQGGVQCVTEAGEEVRCPLDENLIVGEEVHPDHRLHQGAKRALRPRWLRLQGGSRGVLRQGADHRAGRSQGAVLT